MDSSFITDSLSSFNKKGALKHGLPSVAYTSEDFFETECQTVFSNNWVFVGFAHEFNEPGDAAPITVAGQPILLIKNVNGSINAFHNSCSHRCLKLVDEPSNVGSMLSCPYHSWTYNLDGDLCATPFFGGREHHPEGFNMAEHGLHSVKIAIWHDWIFVNLNNDCEDFDEYAEPLINNFKDIDFKKIHPVATLDFGEIATNWKFLMENFIEPYHVQFVHRTTTNQPLEDHYTIVDGVCVGSAIDLDENDKVEGSLSVSSRYLTLFPNFIIGRYFPDQIGVYLNVPTDSGHTLQKRVIYTTDGKAISDKSVDEIKKLWWDVHKEDHAICERMQLGRLSPVAKNGGLLSPYWEDSVRAFQQMVADAVSK
ncbi:MAG: aromatic ring-hydroxylating dioxygenase subunit alpha [Thiotrichales bacterium]|jgi:choline monooxygenase|nr:aromatic ring-hydroxylating dioxygenase subunit alpha [Thiotrichales bacterium]MBT3855123.1 aromatic ring-hydroxylating dioxygenase subunit alpha [Thiotrichales bacterium]MBT4653274.1 aromatic ring-hydroxylating dioxygenase subunit alpha [Thiotrichales bacterium]MBT5500518.1 aromatic ring-hydroxylating dioxygenase subunit alpha [Thiotrichales bacterium]MBT5983887.1 aromatic ring-hydroxylating dioxygenase subunit alpha [Thiotrichales bacterium]